MLSIDFNKEHFTKQFGQISFRKGDFSRKEYDACSSGYCAVFTFSKYYIHRDLKPENILLNDQGHVKLSDFGFSVQLEPGESYVELQVTWHQILKCSMDETHKGYGKEIDLLACGVTLFTLLAGFPLFWHLKRMLRMIMEGQYKFSSPEWDDRLLVVEPSLRLTAEQLSFSSPFLPSVPKGRGAALQPQEEI